MVEPLLRGPPIPPIPTPGGLKGQNGSEYRDGGSDDGPGVPLDVEVGVVHEIKHHLNVKET